MITPLNQSPHPAQILHLKIPGLPYALFILSTLAAIGCTNPSGYRFSEVKPPQVNNVDLGFKKYCALDLTTNFELNAVQCSFYGDYRNALNQATLREEMVRNPEQEINEGDKDNSQYLEALQAALNHPDASEEYRASAQKMIDLLTIPSAPERFAEAQPVSAVDFIAEKARDVHFTLINEAHYNSQNRSFTRDLLKPLWDQGYRYLALEALGYDDQELQERGYPLMSTGYYIKDAHFGNVIREALALGYRLVRYETQNKHDGTLRDRDQARNIYEQTWKKDQHGKVLIHAGYSHIFEMGSTHYEPMGYQLKKLADQEILTIDQEAMVGFNDTVKMHPYYREATRRFALAEPTVFQDDQGEVIVDPINSLGIDLQVYHPHTRFEQGRPHWIKKEGLKPVPLSQELREYEGCLIRATPTGEANDAVPVDQFVISEEKVLWLPAGHYDLSVISCEGKLVATSALEVD